jgi:hypothetical protein
MGTTHPHRCHREAMQLSDWAEASIKNASFGRPGTWGCGIAPFISDDGGFRSTGEAGPTARFQTQSTDRLLETHMSTERSYRAMP